MKVKEINSLQALNEITSKHEWSYLLLYRSNSPTSGCAEGYLKETAELLTEAVILKADVTRVHDIHPVMKVDTVPSFLIFNKGKLKNIIKGCQTTDYYKNLIEHSSDSGETSNSAGGHRVTVYSTPTCPWCTTMKNYLRQHNIKFTDIDVSKDPAKARELVNRTGQTGVPQADINGEMVVGFDKAKINRLLNIKG